MVVFRRSLTTRVALVAGLAMASLGGLALLVSPMGELPLGRALFLVVGTNLAGLWLGLAARRHWVDQPRLLKAEALWAAGAPASSVLEVLGEPAWPQGDLGYRFLLLRGTLHFALGYRDRAWLDGLEAQLVRLPLWKRLPVARAFARVPGAPSARRLAWGDRLLKLAPHMGRLRHLQGILLLRLPQPDALQAAWEHFHASLPLAWEDPLLLEDLLLAGLQHGREDLAEQALAVLTRRHGDPRLPWDRGAAAMHLLRTRRYPEALALVQPLPPDRRTQPVLWLAESVARRQLGDRAGAWRVIEMALQGLPESFRLWMERFQIALELHLPEEALKSLDQAARCIPPDGEGTALRQEWQLRRAEFAFWWEGDPGAARKLLDQIAPDEQGDHHPPLRLQIQVAEGDFEHAYQDILALLDRHPEDVDLLLLQAECLAGMDAWEALRPYLEGLGEACRERATYWHLLGLSRVHLKDPLGARLDLERAVRMDPGDVAYLLDAGHACADLGDWDRAEGHWRQVLQLDARHEEALVHLAEARRALEDVEGARRYLRECLLHHPDSEAAQTRLAELEAN